MIFHGIPEWDDPPVKAKRLPDFSCLIGTPAYRKRVLPGLVAFYTHGLRPVPKTWADLLKNVDNYE